MEGKRGEKCRVGCHGEIGTTANNGAQVGHSTVGTRRVRTRTAWRFMFANGTSNAKAAQMHLQCARCYRADN